MENCYLRRAKGEKKAILSLVSQGQGKFAEGSMLLCFPGQWQHPPPTYTSILEFTGQASLPTFESESDVQKVVMYGHQDHVLYQEKSKDPPLPRAALYRGPWICWTTNVWLLTRFPPPNIKRNILYKSKHKGSIMKSEKTSHELEEAGYSISLFMWWQKQEILVQDKPPTPPVA